MVSPWPCTVVRCYQAGVHSWISAEEVRSIEALFARTKDWVEANPTVPPSAYTDRLRVVSTAADVVMAKLPWRVSASTYATSSSTDRDHEDGAGGSVGGHGAGAGGSVGGGGSGVASKVTVHDLD